jgi:hypothetical protein
MMARTEFGVARPAALFLLIAVTSTLAWSCPAQAKQGSRSAAHRSAEGRALMRALRAHPTVVRKRWFVRRAVSLGLDLPVTVRLTPATDRHGGVADLDDDTFQIDLGTGATEPPLPAGNAAGVVTGTLKGSFGASLRFSQDTSGYGALGTVELGFGAMELESVAGIDLIEDTAGPCALATTSPFAITEAAGSLGDLNLITGTFSMALHTSFGYTTDARNLCGDAFTTTAVDDGTAQPPVFPLRIEGVARISPAITADGRVRLIRLAAAGPQRSSFVRLRTCAGDPIPATCAAGDPDQATVSGRISLTGFVAEVIIGVFARPYEL